MSILTKAQGEWNRSEIARVTEAMAAAGYTERHVWQWDEHTSVIAQTEVEGVGVCKVRYHAWYHTVALVPESCGVFRNDYAFQRGATGGL